MGGWVRLGPVRDGFSAVELGGAVLAAGVLLCRGPGRLSQGQRGGSTWRTLLRLLSPPVWASLRASAQWGLPLSPWT